MKKNKFLAVILAMAVAVGAAGVTTYAVGKDANDTEAPSTVATAASDTEAIKDETVYIMTAADGSTQKDPGQRLDQERPARRGSEGHREPERYPAGEGRLLDRHHPEGAAGEHEHPLHPGRQDRHPQRAGGQERQGDHPLRV